MARIQKYPTDLEISGSDKWIGTDANQNNATKNFTVNKVVSYFNDSNAINSDNLTFIYQDWNPAISRKAGSISFATEQPSSSVPFSGVTEIMMSQNELGRALDLEEFYLDALVDSYIMISETNDKTNFGIYQVNSITRDTVETLFFNVQLSLVKSNGDLIANTNYFLSIVNLNIGIGDAHFTYVQSSPSSNWVIEHSLGKHPSVSIVDDNGNMIMADVRYIDLENLEITFSQPVSGEAFLN
jgi:hypothetical protein